MAVSNRLILWVNKELQDGQLGVYQLQSIKFSRVLESYLTAAAYLRYWDAAFHDSKRRLSKPRVTGEVNIEYVLMKAYTEEGVVSLDRAGNIFYLEDNVDKLRKNLEFSAVVNLKVADVFNYGKTGVIDFDMVKAWLVNDYGVRIPMRLRHKEDNKVECYTQIPVDLALPFDGRIEVTSGLWNVTAPANIIVREKKDFSKMIQQLAGDGCM